MDSMTDVNSLLSNAEKVFSNQASLARAAAREALQGWDEPQNKMDRNYSQRMRRESERLAALAATWEARASTARNGYFLVSKAESQDTEFLSQFADLHRTCIAAGRVVYTRPIDAELNAATSPKPGSTGHPEDMSTPIAVPLDYGNPGFADPERK